MVGMKDVRPLYNFVSLPALFGEGVWVQMQDGFFVFFFFGFVKLEQS